MIKKIIFAASVILVVFSCTYETLEEKNPDSRLVIKTGTVCGWCTINDTLTIIGNSVRYVNYANCSTINSSMQKTGQLKTSEFEALLAQFDFNEFKKLDLNSCNVCVDGCDDWIYFNNGTESHYIRFTRNDPKLQPVKEFVDQLNVIKTQYIGSY